MMFRDINQSSTMARSAYPDGNGELTDFNLFATKYDAGKPSIATDGLPSELSYQVRTAIRRAVDELGINVPEAAVMLKYPIHFYYSDASAELTGVLALPGAVAILALDGFVPKEQLAAPVIGDISRLRETVDELRVGDTAPLRGELDADLVVVLFLVHGGTFLPARRTVGGGALICHDWRPKPAKAAREAYKAKMNAEAPNPQSQAAAAVAAAHGTAEQGGDVAQAAKL